MYFAFDLNWDIVAEVDEYWSCKVGEKWYGGLGEKHATKAEISGAAETENYPCLGACFSPKPLLTQPSVVIFWMYL